VIRVNSQSGKGGVAFVMERDHGLSLPRWLQVELAQVVQEASEQRPGVVDSPAIHALFMEHFVADASPVCLLGYHLDRNGHDAIEARIRVDGGERIIRGEGEGAISAFVDAWQRHSGQQVSVVDYTEHAIGEGTDAEAAAYVQLNVDGTRISGAALDHDTVSASLKAVISALNRARARQARAA
jgi:2-isopropylmalate synthase